MADTTYTNGVTLTDADWFNDVNRLHYTILGDPADAAAALAALSGSVDAGFTANDYDAGTKNSGTFTPDPLLGNFQHCVNDGAFTLAPPTASCTIIIQITNGASAGSITTSGFTKVSGTAPTTTNGDDFVAFITKINGFSHLSWQALQ